MSKFNTIDLFAGCGGLLEGFNASDLYHSVACVEWDRPPVENLIKRLKEKWGYQDAEQRVLHFDIQRTEELFSGWSDDPDFKSGIGLNKLMDSSGEIDVIIGGPPCQAYSLAGRIRDEHGMQNDYRNYLFESYLRVVERCQPKLFIFENVVGMLSASPDGTPIPDLIRKAFNEAGYDIVDDIRNKAVIDLTEYGVPQNRKRVILLGVRRDYFEEPTSQILDLFYDSILPKYKVKEKETVIDAIGDLPKIIPCDTENSNSRVSHCVVGNDLTIKNHIPRFHNERDINIFTELAQDIVDGTFKYVSTNSLKELYTEKTGKESNVHKYYVLREGEQSNTIPAHLYKDGLRHIHPDPTQARSITVREAARLQTFDDDYEFIGSAGSQYKMIGNAVPPRFAHVLALAVSEILTNKYKNYIMQKDISSVV